MRNKHITFVALAVAALAASCSNDALTGQEQNRTETATMTLTANVSEGQTRVGMTKNTDKASFYWHKGDKILVQTVNNGTYSGTEFTTETATGETSAAFTGKIGENCKVGTYAVYPYSENQKHSFTGETKLTYVLPSSYTGYTPGSKIFGTADGYPANSTNMPMLGTISDNSVSFKHLGGLAVIRIDKMPAAEGTLTVTADNDLAGNFSVTCSENAAITNSATSNGSKTVTFSFSNATKDGVGVFYLPLAVGTYTNVKVTITYSSTTQTVNYGTLKVERAVVTAIPLSTDSEGNLRYIVKNSDGTYTINGHTFVDLGLKVLWATMNVGADKVSDYGDYFRWGETKAYTGSGTYSVTSFNDVATNEWGSGCRMPTKDELQNLIDNCSYSSTTQNSVAGYKFTSKQSGYTSSSIFIPAAGSYTSSNGKGYLSKTNGDYWSSTGDSSNTGYAYYLTYSSSNSSNKAPFVYNYDRSHGRSVRAVAPKPTTTE